MPGETVSITWNCVRLFAATAVAVTLGFTWTVGQNGLRQTNTNLCELWKSLPLPAYPSCEFQNILPVVWGVTICAALIWGLIEFLKIIRVLSERRHRLLAYSLISAFFVIGAMISIGFVISEYRKPTAELSGAALQTDVQAQAFPQSQPGAKPSSAPPVIDQTGGEANIDGLQTNGNGTFLRQGGGKLTVKNASATLVLHNPVDRI